MGAVWVWPLEQCQISTCSGDPNAHARHSLLAYTRIEHSTQRMVHATKHVVSLAHLRHAPEVLLQSSSGSAPQERMGRKHINVVSLA